MFVIDASGDMTECFLKRICLFLGYQALGVRLAQIWKLGKK